MQIITITKHDEVNMSADLKCSAPDLFAAIVKLTGILADSVGMEYNEVVENLMEVERVEKLKEEVYDDSNI